MAGLKRRLKNLEAVTGTTRGVQDAAVGREALNRMTDEELEACEGAAVRHEVGENPTATDREIVARAWELNGEVAREFAQKA